MIAEQARAKLNLTLHVTGRRADGYHLLDSLVVFAEVGDRVTLARGPLSLAIEGPFAEGLSGHDNLCLRAARLMGADAAIRLDKRLPVASGIGGGSADAAAVLRGLARMGHPLPDRPEVLGADVPVCLAGRAARMQGVGEMLDPVPPVPPLSVVLVNPGVAVATPAVFATRNRRDNPPMAAPAWEDADGLIAFAAAHRNDLEPAAMQIAPVIAEVLAALTATGARLARMSGSGATCFGIYATQAQAEGAAARLARPGWWVVASRLSG